MFTRVVELTTKSGKNRRDYGGKKQKAGRDYRRFPDRFQSFSRMPRFRGESLERRHIAGVICFLRRQSDELRRRARAPDKRATISAV